MHRKPSLIALVIVAVLSAACGDSGATTTAPVPVATTAPSVTSTTAPPAPTTSATSPPVSATTAPSTTSPTSTTTTTTTTIPDDTVEIVINVTGGEVDGPGRAEVDGGSDVRLIVTADVADELHVHGYDLFADTVPGQPVTIEFLADIPGIFEVELEDARLEILELVVGA